MNREYHHWHSPSLDRNMELLVFGHSGARVIVFPTKTGRFFDYENWRIVESIRDKIEGGHLQLFCVDSIDAESIYNNWCHVYDRIKRHLQYERYILDEVLPFSQHKNANPFVIAHGCSLGAYHAANIAFRHPERFNKVVSFSGRYDLNARFGDYRDLFDGHHNEDIYFNNPSQYIINLHDPLLLEQIKKLDITITVGRDDVLLDNNVRLSQDLWYKGIWHQFHIWDDEAHRARYWREMAKIYL